MSTNGFLRAGWGGAFIACALMVAVSGAKADVPDVVFEITAQAGQVGASFSVLAEWGDYDPVTQTWTYSLDEAVDFWSNDVFLGSLTGFEAQVVGDPEVNLSFSVQSGPSDTAFYIASALLDVNPPIPGSVAEGYAHASYTLTDFDGGSAVLSGIGNTGGAYLAQYNGWAGDPFNGPQGTTFAEGIYAMNAGFLETVTMDFDHPETGYLPIGETVEDMSSLVSFTLSAQDLASGTSSYVIVPEPASVGLLVLGASALLRRR
jgi:hypothetical protein